MLNTAGGAAAVEAGEDGSELVAAVEDGDASSGVEATVGATGTAFSSVALAGEEARVVVVDVEVVEGGGGGVVVVVVVVVVGAGVVVVVVVEVVVVVMVDVLPARNCDPDGRVGRPPRRLVVRVVTDEVSGSGVVVVRLVVVLGTREGNPALGAEARATGAGRVGRVRRVAKEETEELSEDSAVVVVVFKVVVGVPESSVALALASFGE